MTNPYLPARIKDKKRSEGAKKMWEKRKAEGSGMNEKRLDWHLFWMAAGVVVTLASIIIGSYISLLGKISGCQNELSKEISDVNMKLSHEISQIKEEIVKIQTILIIKGIAPQEIFSAQIEEK